MRAAEFPCAMGYAVGVVRWRVRRLGYMDALRLDVRGGFGCLICNVLYSTGNSSSLSRGMAAAGV